MHWTYRWLTRKERSAPRTTRANILPREGNGTHNCRAEKEENAFTPNPGCELDCGLDPSSGSCDDVCAQFCELVEQPCSFCITRTSLPQRREGKRRQHEKKRREEKTKKRRAFRVFKLSLLKRTTRWGPQNSHVTSFHQRRREEKERSERKERERKREET